MVAEPIRPSQEQCLVFNDMLINFIAENNLLDKLADRMTAPQAVLSYAVSNYVIDGWSPEQRTDDYAKAAEDSVLAVYGQEALDFAKPIGEEA